VGFSTSYIPREEWQDHLLAKNPIATILWIVFGKELRITSSSDPLSPPPTRVQRRSVPSASIFFLPFFLFSFSFFFPLRGGGGSEGSIPLHLWCPVKSKEIPPTVERNVKFSNIARKKNFFISITLSLKIFTEMILFFISILKLILQKKNR